MGDSVDDGHRTLPDIALAGFVPHVPCLRNTGVP